MPKLGNERRAPLIVLSAAVILLLGIAVLLFRMDGDRPGGYSQYTYDSFTSEQGVILHLMKTSPANIELRSVQANVAETPYFGINGGFFYEGALLSIAVMNDQPVHSASGYGSGDANVKYARGTLVWDAAAGLFQVQVVSQMSELAVQDRKQYWAQGGISMSLGDDEGWREQIEVEGMPFPDDKRLRTAAVFDEQGGLYLIVSENQATAAEFRQAIRQLSGARHFVDGVFLDGDGSSQMKCTEVLLPGDRREVVQMIRLLQ
ncbi:hypothetical protein FHS18_003322 [Paenibacillus phyllosphaerae]|uniref:Phosphodiester glycosidase domain-containing protein n=1 Tax=Paenibacillus phyllosphaerae TaxID=274593 RepID=A0A7W5FNQ4_9BACL|nr:phosphodiester glycosidase family protein [Paenibacillus phyllosphaerae]MBB3111254.1 hypothetical protein [Paenibacillus phyllosphaerae]